MALEDEANIVTSYFKYVFLKKKNWSIHILFLFRVK